MSSLQLQKANIGDFEGFALGVYAPINSKVQPLPPPGIWTFEDWLVQIPSPRGQMAHKLVLNYLSSKTNFVFNQTLYTLFRERYAVMTPSNFFLRPFRKSYSLIKAKFYLVNPSNPAKAEKTHGRITSGSNAQSNARGLGGDVEVSNWLTHYLRVIFAIYSCKDDKIQQLKKNINIIPDILLKIRTS